MFFAPTPADVFRVLGLFIVGPALWFGGTYYLRHRVGAAIAWFCGFCLLYGGLITTHIPRTSFRRTDLTVTLQDAAGNPVPGAQIAVTQFRTGKGHLWYNTISETHLTDSAGRATIITKSNIRISADIQKAGHRRTSFAFDRDWGFGRRTFGTSWSVLKQNRRAFHSDTAGASIDVPSRRSLEFHLVLPADNDDDYEIKRIATTLLERKA